ncbi:glycosyltransferase involved in cell wall biosynthesis [Knoellia remsis]|uniref:D-inositol 3-phosphate glycosyltransferase n=1 Tax=Knoellia remsis TaxID=407159 RepID=A0A2T0UZ97_9MICO|nr:glycosyltransferase [Knoellia remsis]PRY63236.1 glycosyltransferase involved in cell wall biosynthesis [Knoellia remsis]
MPTLSVVLPGVLPVDEAGRVAIDDKTMSGLTRLADHWPGMLVAASVPGPPSSAGVSDRWHRLGDLPFEVFTDKHILGAATRPLPDLILAPYLPATAALGAVPHLLVPVLEFAPEALAAEHSRSADVVSSTRPRVGAWRQGRETDALVRRVRGVQCNGHPAHDRFSSIARSALLYFDSRITRQHLDDARAAVRNPPRQTVRLCFSGRLIAAKGPRFAIELSSRLRSHGVDVETTVLGTGTQLDELRAIAGKEVTFRGHLPFDPDWTTFVRDNVDLMVLPHPFGDPSGTYLESAGCGVPPLGFDNAALKALVRRHGLGWAVQTSDATALERAAVNILDNPAQWTARREAGLAFMDQHDVDTTSARRVEHLTSLL